MADEEKREEAAHYERLPESLVEPVELLDSHECEVRDGQTTRDDGQTTDEAGRHEVHLERRMSVDAFDASPFSPEVDASHKRSQVSPQRQERNKHNRSSSQLRQSSDIAWILNAKTCFRSAPKAALSSSSSSSCTTLDPLPTLGMYSRGKRCFVETGSKAPESKIPKGREKLESGRDDSTAVAVAHRFSGKVCDRMV